MQPLARFETFTKQQTSGEALAVGRILLGLACLLQVFEYRETLLPVLAPEAVQLPMAGWIPVPSVAGAIVLLAAWMVTALAFVVGWRTTLSGIALTAIIAWVNVIDQQSYSNHVYLMTLIVGLLTVGRAGSCWSIDARAGRETGTVAVWPGLLLRLQLSIVYFFAAISKMNLFYLAGITIKPNLQNSWLVPLPEALARVDVIFMLATFSIATELFLAFAFWLPRHRKAAFVVGVGLHLFILVSYPASSILPLTVFSLAMFAMYAQFVEPATWRRIIQRHMTWLDRLAPRRRPVGQAETPR